jgi:hypothetical protein
LSFLIWANGTSYACLYTFVRFYVTCLIQSVQNSLL